MTHGRAELTPALSTIPGAATNDGVGVLWNVQYATARIAYITLFAKSKVPGRKRRLD